MHVRYARVGLATRTRRGNRSLTTRPLVAQVATYAVDAYPDEMPSQHVMHQGVPAGRGVRDLHPERAHQLLVHEKMRLVPETLPKPYTVPGTRPA